MDVILKVLEGAKRDSKVAIKKEQFLIGRSPKCHLCAGSTAISRKHCAINRTDASVTVKDLGSRNGTLVNGEKVNASRRRQLATHDKARAGRLGLCSASNATASTRRGGEGGI